MTDKEISAYQTETSDLCSSLAEDSEELLRSATELQKISGPLLTGDVVNFALKVLGYMRPCEGLTDQTVCVSSYGLDTDLRRYEAWARACSGGTFRFQEAGTVRNWNMCALQRCLDASFFEHQQAIRKVAFPLFGAAHWSFVILDRDRREFRFYDSMSGSHDSLVYSLRAMLIDSGLFTEPWPITRMDCAQQKSVWECGYSLIGCAAYESGIRIVPGLNGNTIASNRRAIALLAAYLLARSEAGRKTESYLKSRLQNYLDFE